MLEKDKLVRELILLLLRSLKGKLIKKRQCGRNLHVPQYFKAGVSGKNLHQLQVFEAGQLLRHNTELVSVQIPEQRHKVGTGKSNRDEMRSV